MGIFTPGTNLPCFNSLSSIINFISLPILKKFKAVVALAGAPNPTILGFFLTNSLIFETTLFFKFWIFFPKFR